MNTIDQITEAVRQFYRDENDAPRLLAQMMTEFPFPRTPGNQPVPVYDHTEGNSDTVRTLEDEIRDAENELDEKDTLIEKLETKIDGIEAKLDDRLDELEDCRSIIKERDTEIEELKDEVREMASELTKWKCLAARYEEESERA